MQEGREDRKQPTLRELNTRVALPEDLRSQCEDQLRQGVWKSVNPDQIIVCRVVGAGAKPNTVRFTCWIELDEQAPPPHPPGANEFVLEMRRLRWDLLSTAYDLKRAMRKDRAERSTGVRR